MLEEISTNPDENDTTKLWFSDIVIDLFIWVDRKDRVQSFQICYKDFGEEMSLTWTEINGVLFHQVDNGEDLPEFNRSPILQATSDPANKIILFEYLARNNNIKPAYNKLIIEKIKSFLNEKESHKA